MEPIFSIRSSSFLYFYHSGECCKVFETNLSFLSMLLPFRRILPSFLSRYILSVLFVRFFVELQLITGLKEWMKVMICEDFEGRSYNAENGGQWVIVWKNTCSLKIIHRNCAFKSNRPSTGILIKKSCFIVLLFPDSFTVRSGGPLLLHTWFFHSLEWNQFVSSSRFIFFVFLSFRMLPSLPSSNLFLLFLLSSF